MKRALYTLIVSVSAIFTFSSCEKEINNIKYPEYKPKWDISGYLSPDNLSTKIIFSRNLRNYGSQWQFDDMGHPTISLSDGTNLIVFDSTQISYGGGIKRSDFPIEEGKTYTLKVKTDKGFNAEASCTVPFRGNFNLEIDTTLRKYIYDDSIVNISVQPDFYFTDIKGVDNYYMIFCEEIRYNSDRTSPYINPLRVGEKAYFNDKNRDGIRFKIPIESTGFSDITDSCFFKIYLLNTDKVYYDYQTSVDKYNSGEDPFTEPSPVYSNISGGLGIFAAYTVDSLIFRLK